MMEAEAQANQSAAILCMPESSCSALHAAVKCVGDSRKTVAHLLAMEINYWVSRGKFLRTLKNQCLDLRLRLGHIPVDELTADMLAGYQDDAMKRGRRSRMALLMLSGAFARFTSRRIAWQIVIAESGNRQCKALIS